MSRQLEELNLIDNFLFSMMIDHEVYGAAAVQTILETTLQREVKVGKILSEKVIAPERPGLHGIRMDAYIEEGAVDVSGGDVYDLEPDRKENEKKDLPRRARYYHSRTDGKLLKSMTKYRYLPKVWVIFITSYDPFGSGRMVYTVRRHCKELPELDYDDGDETLYLYVEGKPDDDTPRELVQLLHFMGETTWENACNPALKKLMEYVEELRRDPEVKEAYMHWDVYIQSERDGAREEGREEGRAEERVNTMREAARADAAESRAEAAEQNVLAAERRVFAAEHRASTAEEELARTKAALAALEKKYGVSDS